MTPKWKEKERIQINSALSKAFSHILIRSRNLLSKKSMKKMSTLEQQTQQTRFGNWTRTCLKELQNTKWTPIIWKRLLQKCLPFINIMKVQLWKCNVNTTQSKRILWKLEISFRKPLSSVLLLKLQPQLKLLPTEDNRENWLISYIKS